MAVLKQLAEGVLWFFLCLAIPAALLYPVALWAAKHTLISMDAIANGYMFGIVLLFFPTWPLVGFLYRRFVRASTPAVREENSK
jgi:hypothetical protein